MRKIEQHMVDAVRQRRNWAEKNTAVCSNCAFSRVYLHGNHIATVGPFGEVMVNRRTLSDWPTRTTVSRLQALGVDVCIRNFTPVLGGQEL